VSVAVLPADCAVLLGNARLEIQELYAWLTEVTVTCSRKEAWTGRLTFHTAPDPAGGWPVQDHRDVAAWAPARVDAVFGATRETLLDGYVREVKADYPEDPSRCTVTVEMQDRGLALDRQHQRRRWPEQGEQAGDDLIVRRILADAGLALQPQAGGGLTGPPLNQDATDVRFLRERAEANGFELAFEPDGVWFGPPHTRMAGAPQPALVVQSGAQSNCLAFSGRVDAHAPDAVAFDLPAASGSSSQTTRVDPDLPLLGRRRAGGALGLAPFVWRMSREGGSAQDLRRKALMKANDQDLRVRAEGELDGSLYGRVLKTGRTVTVTGVGDTFSGRWYVDSVTHKFSADGYRQAFTLVRNGVGDDSPPAGALGGLLGGVL
jgi:hypothetical protein